MGPQGRYFSRRVSAEDERQMKRLETASLEIVKEYRRREKAGTMHLPAES